MGERIECGPDRVVVQPPWRPTVVALLVGALGVAAGAWLITTAAASTVATVLGAVLCAFFGFTLIGGVLQAARRRPVLVVTAEGLDDGGSLVAAGFLPWSAIGALDLLPARGGRELLVVGVRDPEAVLARVPATRARIARRQAGVLGSPVAFAPGALPVPAAAVRDAIETLRPSE